MGPRFAIRVLRAAVVAAAFAAPLLAMQPASADTHVAATLSTDHIEVDGFLTIGTTAYKPSSAVDLYLNKDLIAHGTADGGGAVSFTVSGQRNQDIYRARIQGVDAADTPRVATGVFTVTACSAPRPNCSFAALPRTGEGAAPLIALGLLLIVGGSTLAINRHRNGKPVVPHGAAAVAVAVAAGSLLLTATPMTPAHAQTTSTGTIEGTVTDSNSGGGVKDICVHAAGSGASFGSAKTTATGTYSIPNLPVGNSYLVGFADCATSPTYRTPALRTSAVVQANLTTSNVNAALARGGTITGRVTDATSGAPIDHTCVLAGLTNDTLEMCTATSGASGAFSTDILPTGLYIVGFVESGGTHAVQYFGNKSDATTSNKVDVAAGDVESIRGLLPAGAVISGKITDATDGKSPQHEICFYDRGSDLRTLASGFIFPSSVGGPVDGAFTLKQLGPGNHKLEFEDCDGGTAKYITEFYNDKATVGAADSLTLVAGQTRPNTDAALLRQGATPASTTTSTSTTSTTAPGGSSSSSTSTSTSTSTPTGSSSSTTSTTIAGGATGTSTSTSTSTSTTTTTIQSNGPATLSSSSVAAGGQLLAAGDGFKPGSDVVASVFSTPIVVAHGPAGSTGKVGLVFTVPASLTPGAHTVELRGIDPAGVTRVLTAPFTVTAAGAAANGGILSRTGREIGSAATVGGSALFLGALLLQLARRRRLPAGLYPER